jgi:hypothetical protein
MTMRAPISLHIERLVVDGLPLTAAQAARLQGSLERELARLIAHGGDPSAWGGGAAQPATARAATAVPWDATRPHQLGRAVARDVFTSLNARSPQASEPRGPS